MFVEIIITHIVISHIPFKSHYYFWYMQLDNSYVINNVDLNMGLNVNMFCSIENNF